MCDYTDAGASHKDLISMIVKTESQRGFKRLVEWLLKRGSRFSKCQLRTVASGCRATFAREPIKEDEEIMFIPREYIITSDVSMASDICREIKSSGVEIRSKHTYLASYLLQERDKGRSSHWFPYIDILPKTFSNIPLFFERKELDLLQGSIALQKIQDRHDSLRAEYQNLRRHVASFRKWTYEDFVWARLVVITRIFGLLINNQKTDGLVPMADMINHRRPRETRWTFNESKQGFVISAMQDFSIGDQIFDSYGRKCNSRFFVNYGFALETNPDNECLLRVVLPHDAIASAGFAEPTYTDFQLPKMLEDKKTRTMFSMLRWSVLQHQNHNQFLQSFHSIPKPAKGQIIAPISIGNEISTLKLINTATQEGLSRFPTTLEQDIELLKDTFTFPMYSNKRNTILMRRGEKQVLHHWLQLTSVAIAFLDRARKKACCQIPKDVRNPEISQYLKSILPIIRAEFCQE